MKSRIALLIVAFVAIVSFAFITVNNQTEKSNATDVSLVENAQQNNDTVGGGYAMEDQDQWN